MRLRLEAGDRLTHYGRVIFFLIGPGVVPPLVILITLAIALYLTFVELRVLEQHWLWWIWWFSLVFLTHFIGVFILRGYVVYRRRNSSRA